MAPARRIALVSVIAAVVLIAVKLAAGLASGSLGLISEAAHSGTDLAAALLTFFAVGVAVRPADPGHQYGHGKAEHLAALAEAAFLVVVSILIAVTAMTRLVNGSHEVETAWWTFAVIGVVIVIDASRATILWRAGTRYRSPALAASSFHFASDLGGSLAVLGGLIAAAAGKPGGDAIAAIFVAVLVTAAAGRLIRQNVDVLMDRAPAGASEAIEAAIARIDPPVELRRIRLRQAAGSHFADVVIGVPPASAVEQGHAAADAVEAAIERAVPGTDVVVHVEPTAADAALGERALAAALRVPGVREIHNVDVLRAGDRSELSLHLKLPGGMPLGDAHDIASRVEAAIREELPQVDAVHTHLEPLGVETDARPVGADASGPEREAVARLVEEATGRAARELRLYRTEDGLVVFLTLAVGPDEQLARAHAYASEIERRLRDALPGIAEVIVHTEP
jgi:cation diffusion facilitator family transporter